MDQELEKLRRACLSDPTNKGLGLDYERKWLRARSVDLSNKVVDLKIVYEGFALSGKTTNLEQLYRMHRKDVTPLSNGADEGNRVLFFSVCFSTKEFVGNWTGLSLRVGLYTVPGACYYQNTRRLLRENSDGFIFIPSRFEHLQRDSMELYEDLLESLKRPELSHCPIVFQRNDGRDGDLSWEEVSQGYSPVPTTVIANAWAGEGVRETLETLLLKIVGDPLKRTDLFPERMKEISDFIPDLPADIAVIIID